MILRLYVGMPFSLDGLDKVRVSRQAGHKLGAWLVNMEKTKDFAGYADLKTMLDAMAQAYAENTLGTVARSPTNLHLTHYDHGMYDEEHIDQYKDRPGLPLPDPIPDTPENVVKAILSTPPKSPTDWKFLKLKGKKSSPS